MDSVELTFAGLAVRNLLGGVPVVAFAAIVTVAAGRVVTALQTHAAGHAAGQFVQLHVESAFAGVLVAFAS